MTHRITINGLDELAGEILPERIAMSVVDLTVNNGPGAGSTTYAPAPSGAPGSDDVNYMSSCTTTSSPGTPGLMGSLGLGSSQPHTSVTCVPTAIGPRYDAPTV